MTEPKDILNLDSTIGKDGVVYFIGIGGIGMSAIARYFLSRGIRVSGYDRSESEVTRELEQEGANVHYSEDANAIPKDAALVVYTPAVSKDHKELVYYQTHNYKVVKRSDVLQAITRDCFNICVAGTHGKTTTTTLIAHILRHSGYGCTPFLGGISVNYNTNFWTQQAANSQRSTANDTCVIEADEYDRSFLKLNPSIAIITAMDADHLDIYGDEETMQDAFIAFGNKVKKDGLLITKFGLKRMKEINIERKLTYSLQNNSADVFATNIKIEEGGYEFDVNVKGDVISKVELKIGGMHNVENTVAAIAVAHDLKISPEKIKNAVADFKGVHRRFEYIISPSPQARPDGPVGRGEGMGVRPVLIDDYAHHPEELRTLLNSVRSLFPQRILTVIFQPHLYTRTRDLADGFANALSIADRVILLPIYPARELPIEGVTSDMILKQVENEEKYLWTKQEMLHWMKEHSKRLDKEFGEVIVMAGAGDIDALVKPVKETLEKK